MDAGECETPIPCRTLDNVHGAINIVASRVLKIYFLEGLAAVDYVNKKMAVSCESVVFRITERDEVGT